jgi:energy-coupling factor transport system substrate-specific component
VSWPLACLLIVGGVLLAGWFAYERAQPSAHMVAVVATLAAVAALGRDAFVALPEVKPITAMTFVVGYALGPLPGFSVGALGMFASNMVLGQGPYTPWQMAAWGLVGLAGAAVGRLGGRRLGRVALALACALAALGAKEIMNLYTWTIGASHTPAALLAAAAAGLPFDLVDAGASLLFGLAFAPELARMLARLRLRLDVRWETAGAAALALALLAGAGPSAAKGAGPARGAGQLEVAAAPARAARVQLARQVAFLARSQNGDGGFGAVRGQRSSELYTAWAAIGLDAAGRDPLTLTRNGRSPLDALRGGASTLEGPGDIERTILALHACGVSTSSFAGRDLVRELLRARAGDGSFEHLVNITTFAVFALRAAGRSAADPAVRAAGRWLARQQNADGGFGFTARGGASDVDDTAAALQGILDAGAANAVAIARAVRFLAAAQNLDGGFPQQPGGESNAQSTSWAIQGLLAAGRRVSAVRRGGGRSALAYLQGLLAPDGSVRYSATSAQTPVWVTAQALTALAGKPFPIAPVRRHGASAAPVGVGAIVSPRSPSRSRLAGGAPASGVQAGGASAPGEKAGGAPAPAMPAEAGRLQGEVHTIARQAEALAEQTLGWLGLAR